MAAEVAECRWELAGWQVGQPTQLRPEWGERCRPNPILLPVLRLLLLLLLLLPLLDQACY